MTSTSHFDNSISWLTTIKDEMKQNLAMLQKQHVVSARRSTSIDALTNLKAVPEGQKRGHAHLERLNVSPKSDSAL